jgi:hypothetical protein
MLSAVHLQNSEADDPFNINLLLIQQRNCYDIPVSLSLSTSPL